MARACPAGVTAGPQLDKTPICEPAAIASIAAWEAGKRACGVSDSWAAGGARGRPSARPRQVERADRSGRAALARQRVRFQRAPDRRAVGHLATADREKGRQRLHLETAP